MAIALSHTKCIATQKGPNMKVFIELSQDELDSLQISAEDLETSVELALGLMTGPEGQSVCLPLFSATVKVSP